VGKYSILCCDRSLKSAWCKTNKYLVQVDVLEGTDVKPHVIVVLQSCVSSSLQLMSTPLRDSLYHDCGTTTIQLVHDCA
jgi:hypothetical protein